MQIDIKEDLHYIFIDRNIRIDKCFIVKDIYGWYNLQYADAKDMWVVKITTDLEEFNIANDLLTTIKEIYKNSELYVEVYSELPEEQQTAIKLIL